MDSKLFLLFAAFYLIYTTSAQDTKRCCFPKRYKINFDLETIFIAAGGFLGYHPTNITITYDFNKPRSLFRTGLFDVATETTSYLNRIRHYNKKLEWIFRDNSPNCTLRELTAPDPLRCIPEESELVDEYHMMEDIEVTDWEIQLNRSGVVGFQRMSVTKEGCLPISEVFNLINYNTIPPSPTVQIGKYKNFERISQSRTNKDFKLPKQCPKDLEERRRRSTENQKDVNILNNMEELDMIQPLSRW